MTTSICVSHKYVEDWHVFSSDDLPGLYVASKDARIAFEDVATSIEKLVLLNESLHIKAAPEMSFKQFLEKIEGAVVDDILVLEDKRFIIREAAEAA